MGVAVDGDADRVMLSDETGRVVAGDEMLALCARDLARYGQLFVRRGVGGDGSVVGSGAFLDETRRPIYSSSMQPYPSNMPSSCTSRAARSLL